MEPDDFLNLLNEGEGVALVYHIYNAAFTHDGEVSANKLYHVVGHEMMHARHKAKGGEWWDWTMSSCKRL